MQHEFSATALPGSWQDWLDKNFKWLLALGIGINATGLLLPILGPDGALYATIAKTIAQTNDFVNLKVEGKDWLDKPHFPFWMAALSYKLFGYHSFAYKLPAFLCWLAGAFFTGRLAQKTYGRSVAQLSVLIYVTAEHFILSNNDVRAEPYLTGLLIASVYYYYLAYAERRTAWVIPGSLLLACAIMTKGIFIAVVVGAGFVLEWILKKQWKMFWHYRWWLAVVLVFVFITPELYCLHTQFDRHPEKIVFGHQGVSGLRFFFWDSQFGRFLNTGPIRGSGDPFFYLHTVLWAFLPWSILWYAAIGNRIAQLKKVGTLSVEYISFGAAVIPFIIFSLSRFQLPHYLNILFPFFAILTAGYLAGMQRPAVRKAFAIIQNTIVMLLLLLTAGVLIFYRLSGWWLILAGILVAVAGIFMVFGKSSLPDAVGRSILAIAIVTVFMNGFLYPDLFRYQAGMQAAFFVNHRDGRQPVYMPEGTPSGYSLAFYLNGPVRMLPVGSMAPGGHLVFPPGKNILLFAEAACVDSLRLQGHTTQVLRRFPYSHISQLTGRFLNPSTRTGELKWMVLAEVHD